MIIIKNSRNVVGGNPSKRICEHLQSNLSMSRSDRIQNPSRRVGDVGRNLNLYVYPIE